ncbi:unnamed protein product [Symbiodinium sp. CCMP2592]|nr:unnamed protein product [Symbiodinium sp. CCMP2592]
MLALTGHDLTWLNPGNQRRSSFQGSPYRSCHPMWNTVKGGIRRSGKQIAYLKFFICVGVLHGPYGSGKNRQSFQEAAESWARNLSFDEFQELQENMIQDGAPEVKAKTWFGSIAAMDWLCGNWSLLSGIMDYLVELDEARLRLFSASLKGRPPGNVCKSCRPSARTGEHNRLIPRHRIRKKTKLGHTTGEYRWRQKQYEKFTTAIKLSSRNWLAESLENEYRTLLQISNQDFAAAHSILASAHGVLQKVPAKELQFSVSQDMVLVGLISTCIAIASHAWDADELRKIYRRSRGIETADLRRVECLWANVLGYLFSEDEEVAQEDKKPSSSARADPGAARSAPKTKGELLMELKSQHKNTMRLVAALLHDRDLRLQLRQIQWGASPLYGEYRSFLSNQKLGQDGSGMALARAFPDMSVLDAQEWLQDEKENLKDFWIYLLELVAKRVWGQVQHAVLCPQMIAGSLSAHAAAADACMDSMKKTWDAVLRAEEVQLHAAGRITPAARKSLGAIMGDLAFNRQSFARECAVVCRMASWNAKYKDVQELARSMYSKPLNTKHDLEDCFAHLASVHQLSTKASPFNKWTRFFYATSMPSTANNNAEYHWPQLETSLREHASMKKKTPQQQQACYGKAFKVGEPLDATVRREGFVKCKLSSTKKAGIISNQKASAATAWVAANHHNDFADAANAWTGCFFTLGCLYQNSRSKDVVLCLGFREYAALGIVLKEVKAEDKDFYVVESTPNATDARLLPTWMINNAVEQSEWMHLPMKLTHPCALPASIRNEFSVAMARVGPNEGLVKSSLEHGVLLRKEMYEHMHRVFNFGTLPAKGHGSGKKKGVIKLDYVRAAVEHFFPTWSADQKHDLCERLMAKKLPHLRAACPTEVLQAFNALSAEDQASLGAVKFLQKDQTAIKGRGKDVEPRSLSEKVHFTPEDLKDMVPNTPGSYITRHPILKRYQAFYPVDSFSVALFKPLIVFGFNQSFPYPKLYKPYECSSRRCSAFRRQRAQSVQQVEGVHVGRT